ncbi:MAG: BolA family transcriptional regulator [Alphaproteobacteria bacterium]|jgi:stress-induced morphogen|nr:BolA family transcriptional regulator [Alphaproteobacteria bacterium]MDP5012756.1 BolA family transcriptional regulator [Alphaproteobacteria bacterium]
MAISITDLRQLLNDAFPDASIDVVDLAGDNDHYQASIVSEQFIGKSRVQQHQMVYQALKGKMGDELHALALKTRTPAAN